MPLEDDPTITFATEEECPICYDTFDNTRLDLEEATLTAREKVVLPGCQHYFCRECLTTHCKHAISNKDIPICCPAVGSERCHHKLSDAQVKELLMVDHNQKTSHYGALLHTAGDAPTSTMLGYWSKFQRFKRQLEDPSLISCTKCSALFHEKDSDPLTLNTLEKHQLVCPHCKHSFCKLHGDSHQGKPCPGTQVDRTQRLLNKYTKPCSHCGIAIHKESGCDHIVCLSCKQDMCFKCGSHDYLTGEMVRSCSLCSQNYIDHRYIWRYRITLFFTVPFYIPICIIYIVFTTVLALLTFGCCCCLCCGMRECDDEAGEKTTVQFRPREGIAAVFSLIFMPAIDLGRQCGLECCQRSRTNTREEITDSSITFEISSEESSHSNEV